MNHVERASEDAPTGLRNTLNTCFLNVERTDIVIPKNMAPALAGGALILLKSIHELI